MKPRECLAHHQHGVCCDGLCDLCGFNPAEQKRRLKEGRFQYATMVHYLHDENGKLQHTARQLCKQLLFTKGELKNV